MSDQPSPQMAPPPNGVIVRMYRVGGLGDCYLLAFRTQAGHARYVLIDCGVFLGTKDGSKRLQAIARDLQAATGGRLDVLIATHEHWDHVAGFQYARHIFDEMEIDEAWLAWTECPGHPLAERLRKRREITLRALDSALQQLRALNSPLAARLEGILSFHDFLAADTKLRGSYGQMQYVQQKAHRTRYLSPNEQPLSWLDVPGLRFFVLGPPEDEELLSRSDPSGLEGEVYERPDALNTPATFYASVLAGDDPEKLSPAEQDIFNRSLPFDRAHGIHFKEAYKHKAYGEFFQSVYGFPGLTELPQGADWRRIDMDWWGQVENLALQLDNDTNNTSLALAIELPGGKVLLFPGDAQLGNWHSWHKGSWLDEKKGTITATDLLQRTVLYKVGHHGSHNATLRAKGLELMTHPDLVAMIPVYKQAAEKRGWAMPFPALLSRLKEKTRGRILYSDPDFPDAQEKPSPELWDSAHCIVREDQSEQKLWVELVIETEKIEPLPLPKKTRTAPARRSRTNIHLPD
jgi:hypothetical protein